MLTSPFHVFRLPPKDVRPFEQPLHFLVYLVLGAGGTLYLLPSKLDALFATDAGNVTISVLGWLAMLTAMYSVLVLPAAHPVRPRKHRAWQFPTHIVDLVWLLPMGSFHRQFYGVRDPPSSY